ncbi:MAG: hypothetical protein E7353_06475 [Clostridiales bacterium]|nr:hypothetical protein [Clostridiales bacterium]
MLSNIQTVKYPLAEFELNIMSEKVTEKELTKNGFIKTHGCFACIKKTKCIQALIAIEDEESEGRAYAKALAVKNFLDFYHISNIGILLVIDTIPENNGDFFPDADILFLHFNTTKNPNAIPNNNVFCGVCNFTVSPYPSLSQEKMFELREIALKNEINCRIENCELKCVETFSLLTELEVKLLNFANKTAEFDKKNLTISRISVDKMSLPVVNNEYYLDLFTCVPRQTNVVEYLGQGGNLLDGRNGIFMDVNVNSKQNVESLYCYIQTFVEDING